MLKLFDDYFQVRRNIIFERARFNRRDQLQGESSEQYIMELYSLAANCDYGALENEMICDRLVVGIRDQALSKRLQLDATLTLEKAKTSIRQQEAVQEQQTILHGTATADGNLDSIRPEERTRRHGRRDPPQRGRRGPPPKHCTRCGKEPHPRDRCPARNAVCHRCDKRGHYGSQCRSKNLDESAIETAFLDATTSQAEETAWFADISVCKLNEKVTFKLDTGAEVTAVSQETYEQLRDAPPLNTPEKTLCGPSRKPLKVRGQCQMQLTLKVASSKQQVFVVEGLKSNLLGLPAITALHLARRLDETRVNTPPETLDAAYIHQRFKKLFQGLGNLGEVFKIQLKPGATPFAIFTPRRVPLPLKKKVSEELQRMETMGVISRVDTPTPWCAGMVIAPKKSGSVRICVNLKPLNQSVLREVPPLPRVDETLAQLTGAKYFSKLDANSGFWQIPIAPASRLLTTFITPFGRYCFNKLPFSVSSTPEHFQKPMSTILAGLEGTVCQMDDVLVFGRDKAQHDTRLLAALQRTEAAGVTLNADKCEFTKTSITFLGHKIDQTGIKADPEKTKAIRNMRAPITVPELRRFMGMVNQLGKFTPKPRPSHSATRSTPRQEHPVGMGPRPERGIYTGERGTFPTYNASPLRLPGTHQTLSRCLIQWLGSCTHAADRWTMETSSVRLALHD